MEINEITNNLIDETLKNYNSGDELEVRFYNGDSNKSNNHYKIDYYKFINVRNQLIFSKENGGKGFPYKYETSLDIINDDSGDRITIKGKDNVKKYWLTNELEDFSVINKTRKKIIDIEDYGFRLSLSNEKIIDKSNNFSSNKIKTFRLKNRYEIIDGNFRYDLTMIKMIKSENFKKSNIFQLPVKYEIEIEYINNKDTGGTTNIIKDKLFENINFILKLIQNSNHILSFSESKEIKDRYLELIYDDNENNIAKNNNSKKLNSNERNKTISKFIAVSPVTLHPNNLAKLKNNYAVTPKADGLRNLLYVVNSGNSNVNSGCYLIDGNLNLVNLNLKAPGYENSVIEGEYIPNKKMFLCYDILFSKNSDIRNKTLLERLKVLDLFIKTIKCENFLIERKKYLYDLNESIYKRSSELWQNKDSYLFDIDGLIFTPINSPYPNKGRTWNELFKWKPAELNSFDFLIKFEKNADNENVRLPITYIDKNGMRIMSQYKLVNLYVGKYNSQKRKYLPELFSHANGGQIKLLINDEGKIYAENNDEIIDNVIVEFIYDKNNRDFPWIALRVRYDKTNRYNEGEAIYGNDEKIALDIWNNLKNPVTDAMLFENDTSYYETHINKSNNLRLPLQNFHNLFVKKNIIESAVNSGSEQDNKLLDLACGNCGDLSKWTNAKIKDIIAFDIDKICVDKARKYYNSYNNENKPDVQFFVGDTSKLIFPSYAIAENDKEKNILKNVLPAKYSFDIVSCQFCVHYYFTSELKLRALLQNVTDNLKIGGYFIGTSFDGKRVVEALKGKKLIEGNLEDELIWRIEKKYNDKNLFSTPRTQFKKEIDVYFKSIGKIHTESLVNFDFFTEIALQYGLKLELIEEFGKIYNDIKRETLEEYDSVMTDEEKDFSFLNNTFKFKKIETAPDSLRKKYFK